MWDSLSSPPEGLIGGYQGGSIVIKILMAVFSAIALYNAVELVILIFLTFTRYSGLYFWTMLLSDFFAIGPLWFAVTFSTIGFYFMVPGQSIVLYSRLHLVVQSQTLLRRILYLIIFDTIILLIPTTILTYSTIYIGTIPIIKGYNVMERMQLAWFCAQEILISIIYIFETLKILRLRPEKDPERHKTMYELIAINLVIILMDIALLVLEYVGLYTLQTTLKAAVYSIKLKLEFGVLRKLVSLVHTRHSDSSSSDQEDFPTFVDPDQITGDVTHAAPANSRRQSRYPWTAISMDSLVLPERRSQHVTSSEIPRSPL
ncbi:integral membrane protein [Aspergillus sclerotioniger CBS 115572]|uniref:Integral membrane protein n=1 Tax=Aspergillus sclerotioniger CBS 115572 TaxID=1450535 RepID=A0A317X716_9EURO|nr:integral membrane protein [Aspergillus sclerotioniger CBS 115572]PWY93971.1 integral membrane protein [Aspergillus sclerotioniger CBS 115572]